MFLKKVPEKCTGRIYLSMARSYRAKGKKYPQAETVESFDYLDELKSIYDDPSSHFEKYAAGKNLESKREPAEYIISAKKNQRFEKNTSNRMNYGYIIIMNRHISQASGGTP